MWNVPLQHEADEFLKECLNHYFGEGKHWHFYSIEKKKRSLVFYVSKVVDRLMKRISNFTFMKAKKG